MFSGRDILGEHAMRTAEAESLKRARAMVPIEPEVRPTGAQLLGATQRFLENAECSETDAIICVEVKDEFTDQILDEGIDWRIEMFAKCVGAYFKTDVIWEGEPV